MSTKHTPANTRRIVACVNACAGMDDPAKEIEQLRNVNDDLCHALKRLRQWIARPWGGDDSPEQDALYHDVNDAIASCYTRRNQTISREVMR